MKSIDVDVKSLDLKTLKALVYDGYKGIENCNSVIQKIQKDIGILNTEILRKETEAQEKQAELFAVNGGKTEIELNNGHISEAQIQEPA